MRILHQRGEDAAVHGGGMEAWSCSWASAALGLAQGCPATSTQLPVQCGEKHTVPGGQEKPKQKQCVAAQNSVQRK